MIAPGNKHSDKAELKRKRTEAITRIVALVVVFVSVFYFFIKLLFL